MIRKLEPLGSTSIICKKSANVQKSKCLLRNLVIKQKMCKIKNAQITTNYTFLKSHWLSKFKCVKSYANFKTQMCNQEKLKICKFSLKASVQNSVKNFFAKIVQYACFCYWLPKELYNLEIQWLKVSFNIDLVWCR